jgi:hypothetical protein
MRLNCPHCGAQALSVWGKLSLGPIAQRRCRRCGLAIGTAVVPALIALTPCAIDVALMAGHVLRHPPSMIASAALAFAMTCALYLWWVPLAPRELTRREAVEASRRDGA